MKRFLNWLFPLHWGSLPYLWLLYMIVPLYDLATDPQFTDEQRYLGYACLLLFTIPYRGKFHYAVGRAWMLHILAEILILAVMIAFISPTFLSLAFYPTAMFGYLSTRQRLLGATLTTLLFLMSVVVILYPISLDLYIKSDLVQYIISILLFPFGVHIYKGWRDMMEKLRAANAQIERLTQEAERQRIARDLHDTLGHALSMITLKSELAEKLARKDPERAAKEMREVQQTSRTVLSQVREMVSNMYRVSLEDELVHTQKLLEAAQISFQTWGDITTVQVNAYTNTVLAMCLREAVNNVVKHSKARQCSFKIRQTATHTEMSIRDDGIGLKARNAEQGGSSGHGLLGMRQRLELVGGTLDIQSGPEHGTEFIVIVPRIVSGRQITG